MLTRTAGPVSTPPLPAARLGQASCMVSRFISVRWAQPHDPHPQPCSLRETGQPRGVSLSCGTEASSKKTLVWLSFSSSRNSFHTAEEQDNKAAGWPCLQPHQIAHRAGDSGARPQAGPRCLVLPKLLTWESEGHGHSQPSPSWPCASRYPGLHLHKILPQSQRWTDGTRSTRHLYEFLEAL